MLAEPDLLLRRLLAAFGDVVGVVEADGKDLCRDAGSAPRVSRAEGASRPCASRRVRRRRAELTANALMRPIMSRGRSAVGLLQVDDAAVGVATPMRVPRLSVKVTSFMSCPPIGPCSGASACPIARRPDPAASLRASPSLRSSDRRRSSARACGPTGRASSRRSGCRGCGGRRPIRARSDFDFR